MKLAFDHPDPNLQAPWRYAQFGLLILPFSPSLGGFSIGLAALLTWLREYRTIIHRPLNWGFAGLSVLLVISSIFAYDKTQAFLGLFNLLPYFLFFAGFSTLIQTPAQLRHIAWILVISSVPVVIMGFGQMFWGWHLDIQILWILLDIAIAPGGEPPGRMAAIFMHANIFAAYQAIAFTLGLGLWLEQWRLKIRKPRRFLFYAVCKFLSDLTPNPFPCREGEQESKPLSVSGRGLERGFKNKSHIALLLFLTLSIITNFVALILTDSRNGWAMAMVACLAYAMYQGWRIIVGSVVGVVTTVLLAAFAPSPVAPIFRRFVPAYFWGRLNDQMYPDRPVAMMRKTQWEFAWSLTQQQPWTGWGLRSFSALYKAKMQIDLGHPHNLFLMLCAETGLPSALLFYGLVSWILIAGFQLLRTLKNIAQTDKLIFFSYLVVTIEWVLFNTVDVTLFDFRLNTFSWVLLSVLCGGVYHFQQHQKLNLS
ncbi:MAG: O-antigen ligase family protein [Nostoc sp. LLA-1]|nr:O-antigen ligase family protein [Cyanocohniella sp. LLY]